MSAFEHVETTRPKSDNFTSPQIILGETESLPRADLDNKRRKEDPKAVSKDETDISDNNYTVDQRLVEMLVSKLAEVLHFGKDIAELKNSLARLVLEIRNLSLIFLGSSAKEELHQLARLFEMSWEELEQEETLRIGELHQKVSTLAERNLYLEAEIKRLQNLQSALPDPVERNFSKNTKMNGLASSKIKISNVKLTESTSPKLRENIIQLDSVRFDTFFDSKHLYVLQNYPTTKQTGGESVVLILEDLNPKQRQVEVYKKVRCHDEERCFVEKLVSELRSEPHASVSRLEQQSINLGFRVKSISAEQLVACFHGLFEMDYNSIQQQDLQRVKKSLSPNVLEFVLPSFIERLTNYRYDYDDPPKHHPDLVEASHHHLRSSQSNSNSAYSDEFLLNRQSEWFLGPDKPTEQKDYDIDRREKANQQARKYGSLSLTGSSKKIQEFIHSPPQSRRMQSRLKFHLSLGWLNSPIYCLKYNKDSSLKSNRNNIYLCGGTALQNTKSHRFFFLKSSMDTMLESKPKLTLKNATLSVLDVYSCYEFTIVAQGNLEQGGHIFLAYPRSSNWHELKYQFLTYYQASLTVEGKRRLRHNNVIHFSSNSFVFVSTLGSLVWARIHPKSLNQPKEEFIHLKVAPKECVDLISFNYPNVVFSTSAGRVMSTNLLTGSQLVFPQTFESILGLISEKNYLYLSTTTPRSNTSKKGRLHFLEFTTASFSHLRTVDTQAHLIQLTIISESKASTRKLVAGLPRSGSESSDHFRLYDFSSEPPQCVADYRDWWSGGSLFGICQVEDFLLLFGERAGADEDPESTSIAILELKF